MTFDNWWNLYPKKVGKKASRKIWEKEKLDLRSEELIEKLRLQVKKCARFQVKMYVPNPSTYLNGEMWEDEIIPMDIKHVETEQPKKCANCNSPPVGSHQGKSYCTTCLPLAFAGDL